MVKKEIILTKENAPDKTIINHLKSCSIFNLQAEKQESLKGLIIIHTGSERVNF